MFITKDELMEVNAIYYADKNGKREMERKESNERVLNNTKFNDGSYGVCFELWAQPKNAKHSNVSNECENLDGIIYLDNNGKRVRRKLEVKTGGGRVSHLIEMYNKKLNAVIVYKYIFKNHKGEIIELPAKIVSIETFIETLYSVGALKMTNGKNNQIAIQVSSKKWRNAVDTWTNYYTNRTYSYNEIYN